MKRAMTVIVALIIAVAAGVFIAPYIRIYPQEIRNTGGIVHTGDKYSFIAYEQINVELRHNLESIIKQTSGRPDFQIHSNNQHLVVVSPTNFGAGYDIQTAAPRNSPIWDEKVQTTINDWIDQRMNTLDSEYKQLYRKILEEAEQDDTPPQDEE